MTQNFDPNSVGNINNTVFGLPFTEDDAELIIIPMPWDATVSYRDGAALGPQQVLESSYQVDLYDEDAVNLWQRGIYMCDIPEFIHQKSIQTRELVEEIIEKLEEGQELHEQDQKNLDLINTASTEMNGWLRTESARYLSMGKKVAVLGGDHSTPFGYFMALADHHTEYSILQIDAHMDLREAYENFHYSHASIMYNVRQEIPQATKIVQVGLRDFCDEEVNRAQNDAAIVTYTDRDIRSQQFRGISYDQICEDIVSQLGDHVYVSFDIDGLRPELCPHTGTPVPGGLDTQQAYYLLNKVVDSGRKIIGFDLSEVAGDEDNHSIDSIVGARILYKLSNLLLKSNG